LVIVWGVLILVGVGLIVWGSETFAEHLGAAAIRLGVSSFALALLLAGAEPEELATGVTASLRGVPAIAFGDLIGANITICLVALGVGTLVTPLPFGRRVMRYALFGLPMSIIASGLIWDGKVNRWQGLLLVSMYILYIAVIWWVERQPPSLGETKELTEAHEKLDKQQAQGINHRIGKDLLLVLVGLAAIVIGSVLLVESVRQIAQVEETQTKLGLTLLGLATSFELITLAWSMARRGATEATVAGVVGSFTYNMTMGLGTAAFVRPLRILDAQLLHFPILVMLASLTLAIALAWKQGYLGKTAGKILIAAYLLFIFACLNLNY
jgi:cation:H+ antiporter